MRYANLTMKNQQVPVATVLLPVYNGQKYIRRAINSLLAQKFKKFELLIINDGSTDRTKIILDAFVERDDRVRVIHHRKNRGLVATLNEGLKEAKTNYVARMDADDISLPDRLGAQIAKIREENDYILVGSSFQTINAREKVLDTVYVPYHEEDLRRALWLGNPFAHASVIFNRNAALAVGGYSDEVGPTEDYDLWLKLAQIGSITAVDRVLLQYRYNPDGISISQNKAQEKHKLYSISRRWEKSQPKAVSRKQLVERAAEYMTNKDPSYGIGAKKRLLHDVALAGFKMIRHGKILIGLGQLLIVASTGRTGLKITVKRILGVSPKLIASITLK